MFLVAVNAQDNSPSFEVVSTSVEPGKEVDVKIRINNNPGITALQLNVEYSNEDLVLQQCVYEGLFDSSVSTSLTTNNPFIISWYSKDSTDSSASGDFVTLKFTAKENVQTSDIKITYDKENVFNSKFENQTFDVKNGVVDIKKDEPTEPPTTEPDTIPSTSPQIAVQSTSGSYNDTVEVKLLVNNNPDITALRIAVDYSMDDLELIEILDGGLFDESITHSKSLNSPVNISWYSQKSVDCNNNGTLAVLRFKIKDNAKTSNVNLSYDEEDIFNVNFDNVKFETVNGKVEVKDSKLLIGDVNLDGVVSVDDATLLQKYVAGSVELNDTQLAVADARNNGSIDIDDVTHIQKYIAGLVTALG